MEIGEKKRECARGTSELMGLMYIFLIGLLVYVCSIYLSTEQRIFISTSIYTNALTAVIILLEVIYTCFSPRRKYKQCKRCLKYSLMIKCMVQLGSSIALVYMYIYAEGDAKHRQYIQGFGLIYVVEIALFMPLTIVPLYYLYPTFLIHSAHIATPRKYAEPATGEGNMNLNMNINTEPKLANALTHSPSLTTTKIIVESKVENSNIDAADYDNAPKYYPKYNRKLAKSKKHKKHLKSGKDDDKNNDNNTGSKMREKPINEGKIGNRGNNINNNSFDETRFGVQEYDLNTSNSAIISIKEEIGLVNSKQMVPNKAEQSYTNKPYFQYIDYGPMLAYAEEVEEK